MTGMHDASRMVVVKFHTLAVIAIFLSAAVLTQSRESLFIAPLYVEYTSSTLQEFTNEVNELRRRIGKSPGVKVGFAAFLNVGFKRADLNQPIDEATLEPTLAELDRIVSRSRSHELPVHISIASGFFHNHNELREAAIRADVRNAQWFSDGWIADPADVRQTDRVPRSAWVTPSRYAQPLRQRIQETMRILGRELAEAMEENPERILSVSGDTEVELSFARTLDSEGRARVGGEVLLADYSPFMVAESRDWVRSRRYNGDASPATDDDRDGHTFNQDFRQQFRTWNLRYFNESGTIPYEQYRGMVAKLPSSGPYFIDGGFDAPRVPSTGNPFWDAWQEFRVLVVRNYLRDFGEWITDGSRIPPSRFYTHQIPAEYLFGGRDTRRLATSASPLETALIPGMASPGVTVYDTFNGKTHSKTSGATLFRRLQESAPQWGILEYSPSVPPVDDENHYLAELRAVHTFKPTLVVPFAWTNVEWHRQYRIQDTAYERALRKFVQEAGSVIHR